MKVLCSQVRFAYPYKATAHKTRHVIVCYVPVYTGKKLSETTSENLACAKIGKNEETFAMVLSLQGLYNFFICLLNKYTHTDCIGLTNVTFQDSSLLA